MKFNSKKFTVEDFPEQQDWIGPLLSGLNQFIQDAVSGINTNNVTVEENLYQEIKEIKFLNESGQFPIKFKPKFNIYPKGLTLIYCSSSSGINPTSQPWVSWTLNNQGLIEISSISNLTTSLTYTMRFLIIYK